MEQLKNLITAERQRMYNHLIYVALKRYGIKYIQDTTVKNVKLLVIMDRLGFPITVSLYSFLIGKRINSCYRTLQSLGDKNVIDLAGYSKNRLVYYLHEDFRSMINNLDYSSIDLIGELIQKEGLDE
jgi:hypothetical protein